MSRIFRLLPMIVLLLAIAYLHHEVLFRGQVYHMDDAADGYYPSHVAIFRAYLKEGVLPTWETGSWSGFPLLADPYYGAFYPASWLFPVFGMARGLGVAIALHMILGGLGMYLLLRRRGLSLGPALFGGVSLGLSSFMVERIRHIIFPELLAYLPWILYTAEGYLADPRQVRCLVGLSLCLGLSLLCGGLPLLPFAALGLAAYLLPRILQAPGHLGRKLGPLCLAAVIGCLVGMAQLLPTLAHLPHSPRQLGVDYAFASTYAWPDPSYLGLLVMPDLLGGAARGHFRGVYNHWEMAGWYVGVLAVVFLPLGLWRKKAELYGLAAAGLLGVLLAFGDATPVHRWFFHHVPVYAALRCPVRALFLFLLAAPILSAEGLALVLERLEKRAAVSPKRLQHGIVAGVVCVLSVAGPRLVPQGRVIGAAVGHLVLVLGVAFALLVLLRGGLLRIRGAGLLLALCAVVDLVVVDRRYIEPRPADFVEGTERFGAVNYLIEKLAGQRGQRFAIHPMGPFRLHNVGMVYDMEGACGYDSYSIWRYAHYLYVLNHGAPYPYKQLRKDPAAGDIHRFDSPLFDLLNIHYVISPDLPAPGFVERYRLPPGPLAAKHEPLWDPQLKVYESPHPLPRAFVVHGAKVLPKDEDQVAALLTLDPRVEAIVEKPPIPAPPGDGRVLSPAQLRIHQRHRLVIETELAAPGILVVSEPAYPGWSVKVDGTEAPLLRVNYAFRGVALSAGRHTAEMNYQSRPTEWGIRLSLLGIVGLLVLGLIVRISSPGIFVRLGSGGAVSSSEPSRSRHPPL